MAIQGLVSVDGVKLQKINNLLYPIQIHYAGIWLFSLVKHEALHHGGFRSKRCNADPADHLHEHDYALNSVKMITRNA